MFKVSSADGVAEFLFILEFEGPVISSYGRGRSPGLAHLYNIRSLKASCDIVGRSGFFPD